MDDLIEIAPAFSYVLDKGFVSGASTFKTQESGNASLVLRGMPFSLRFKRVDEQILVDIGNDVLGWHPLSGVLELVNSAIRNNQLGSPPDVTLMADLLMWHWDEITHLFSDRKNYYIFQRIPSKRLVDI